MEYTFTLKYQLSTDTYAKDRLIEKLTGAGCEDAFA